MRLCPGVLLLSLLVFSQAEAWGMPFDRILPPTLSEQVDQADAVVLVKWTGSETTGQKSPDAKAGTLAKLVVVETLRDPFKTFKPGSLLTRAEAPTREVGDLLLLLKSRNAPDDWIPISAAAFQYLKKASAQHVAAPERLKYFVKFLEHTDSDISEDAYSEFNNCEFDLLRTFAAELPRERIRQWVLGPMPITGGHLSLYGVLLGLIGDAEDARGLESIILTKLPRNEIRLGMPGVMSGYLMLRGEAGLRILEQAKFSDTEQSFDETYAALQAVRFMWFYGGGKISPERLQASIRILLSRAEIADIAVTELARYKDWSVMDRVLAMYGTEDEKEFELPNSVRAMRRAIIHYMLAAAKDRPLNPAAPQPVHVTQAKKNLDELRKRDPKTVADVERFAR